MYCHECAKMLQKCQNMFRACEWSLWYCFFVNFYWVTRHPWPAYLLWVHTYRYPYPQPVYTGWSSVHWNATGWHSVHWDATGRPSKYLQGTLEHHWKNSVESAPHWKATGETLTIFAYTGTPLEKLSWNCPTLWFHWRNSNFCSLQWNTIGWTLTTHTHRPI